MNRASPLGPNHLTRRHCRVGGGSHVDLGPTQTLSCQLAALAFLFWVCGWRWEPSLFSRCADCTKSGSNQLPPWGPGAPEH